MTGEGLDFVRAHRPLNHLILNRRNLQVRTFLNLLPSSEADSEKFAADQPLEFSVTEVWSVPYVGTVVNGIMNAGSVKTGDAVLLGPDSNGNYTPTVIKSIQRKRYDNVLFNLDKYADLNNGVSGQM